MKSNAFDELKTCINTNRNFVMQGGAGSGKTETLKRTLEYIHEESPEKKVACITHTNLAVDEIKSRVRTDYEISTIHSFLNSFIKDYKKNIHQVIHTLFQIEPLHFLGVEAYDGDAKEHKKEEHEKYKKVYKKYAATLFTVKNERAEKHAGKREYDKEPERYFKDLNARIESLNNEIINQIKDKDYSQIAYNETRFNNFNEISYGHDGLLEITSQLFERYPLLLKIIQDKYDCIFIDEYQDTSEKIIDIFMSKLSSKILIGLYGDSMQAIYENGIGDVEKYVENNKLKRIDKEDNYRCSEQVKDFINKLRTDGLEQQVAFKIKEDGTEETLNERQGSVKLYYSSYVDKPHSRSPKDSKAKYLKKLDELIEKASEGQEKYKELKLTNRAIAFDAGFGDLYEIFSDRYAEPLEKIESHLARLQFTELVELCNAYKPMVGSPDYNFVLSKLKQQGLSIKSISDKQNVRTNFDKIIQSDDSAINVLNMAYKLKLLKKSEKHLGYIEQKKRFLQELKPELKAFEELYLAGKNTHNRIKGDMPDLTEEEFEDLQSEVKRKIFYERLFSGELHFQQILKFFSYMNEETKYITMHRTKGSGIENVLVVMDEYFWNRDYDFKTVFSNEGDLQKKSKSQKLFYVACSRAIKNLRCVKLVSDEAEEEEIKNFFEDHIKI
ncbi:DNA helicase II [Gimesia chilikensis]|nr:DNA helicase II [Gimesia chilikensis]